MVSEAGWRQQHRPDFRSSIVLRVSGAALTVSRLGPISRNRETMTRKERLFPDHSMIVAAQSSQQDYRRKDWTSAATRASLPMTLGF